MTEFTVGTLVALLWVVCINIAIIIVFAVVIPTIVTVGNRRAIANRLRDSTVPIQTDSPLELSPACIGYLYEGKLSIRELLAMVIYLDQSKSIQKHVFEESVTVGLKDGIELENYSLSEQAALSYLGTQPDLSDTKTASHYVKKLRHDTHAELVNKRLLKPETGFGDTFYTWLIILTAISNIALTSFVLLPYASSVGLVTGVILVGSLVISVITTMLLFVVESFTRQKMGSMSYATDALIEQWPLIEGYRRYLKSVELDRVKFDNATQATVNNKAAPYVIALGLDGNWETWLSKWSRI